MRITPKRVLLGITAVVGAAGYVWVAAVQATPAVRRRKAAERDERRRAAGAS